MTTTTDPTGLALHRAILLDPADDDRRLVFADWLEEHGEEERAEFVRVQLQIAELRRGPCGYVDEDSIYLIGDPTYRRLMRRVADVFKRASEDPSHWARSAFALPDGVEISDGGVFRGFIESVDCTCEAWLAHGPTIMAGHPVTRVGLTNCEPAHIPLDGGDIGWCWNASHDSELPREIGELLDGGEVVLHDTPMAARDSLSDAAVLWARLQALGEVCSACGGTGKRPLPVFGQTHYTDCSVCGGLGRVMPTA